MQNVLRSCRLRSIVRRCPQCLGLLRQSTPARHGSSLSASNTSFEDDFDDEVIDRHATTDRAADDDVAESHTTLMDARLRRTRQFIKLPAPSLSENDKIAKTVRMKRRRNHEVLALFDACIATKNLGRSLSLLKQIRSQADDATTLQALNRYLSSLVRNIGPSNTLADVRLFFHGIEDEWHVPPDAISYAYMLKAELMGADEVERGDRVKQLVNLWRSRYGDFGEVLSISSVLSSQEAQTVFDISGLDLRVIGEQHRENLKGKSHPLQGVPELKPTPQRGVGLKLVKHSLEALTNPEASFRVDRDEFRKDGEELSFNLARQRLLEENAVDAAVLRWRHEHEDVKKRGGLAYKKSLNAMFWEWKEHMLPLIEEELARIDHAAEDVNRKQSGRAKSQKILEQVPLTEREADYQVLTQNLESDAARRARRDYGPFLGLLKAEKMAAVAILELIRTLTTESVDGMKTTLLCVKIGKAIEDEYHSEVLKKRGSQELFQKTYKEAIQNRKSFSMSVRQARANAIKKHDAGLFTPEWTPSVRAGIGSLMMSFIMYAARIQLHTTDAAGREHKQEAPAFYNSYQYTKGQKLGVVKCNETLTARLSSEPLKGSIYPRLLPMLTPPRPWYSFDSGGYLFTKTLAMRAKSCPEQIQYLKSASDQGLLNEAFTGLDVLGFTPWKINHRVFQCALEAWNSGEAIADIPPATTEMDLPEQPAHDADPAIKFAYIERIREANAIVKNYASMRSDINYKLEIARAFLNDTMYFPHSLDFRGRAYPIPPHFNHLGNDLCRGLLKFGSTRVLGENGLRWLKIHLANQCGYDKASFEEREAFADKNMQKVYEAADFPMDGTRWWLAVDNPWQCLATCFELAEAMRSEDPTKYESSMPVHQDGTCNGLQHYAALGGDKVGAKQVNLEPSERPQDVYRGVADIVNIEVEREAHEGHPQAKLLKGHITRKLVKQTVMTNVYGVTWVGARLQIENQLNDMLIFKEENIFSLASYMVNKVFLALKSMFTGAHEIQEWLRQSSQIVTRSIHFDALIGNEQDPMTAVIWTSPLDLPIVQPYRKEVRRQVYTNLQTVFLSDPADAAEVNSKKQSSAFPPNYIHSLDATHMLMSALACREQDICFAAVHDSYWTHAADTDKMNVILRDAFVKLHSSNLMAELEAEFHTRYAKHYTPHFNILRTSPAYGLAIRAENLESGKVQVLPKQKGIVITDRELAAQVLNFSLRSQKIGRRTSEQIRIDSNFDVEAALEESEAIEDGDEEAGEGVENTDAAAAKKQAPRRQGRRAIWTPIEFPKLPGRGEFDVRRVKESKYFFS